MTRYEREKARIIDEAIQFQNSFTEGKNWSYGELAEIQDYFEKQGKRHGLLEEFRENGII